MDVEPQPGERRELRGAGLDLERRFRLALVLYAFLAAGVFWAQVAEWLMAADCKSAGHSPTEVRTLPCAPGF